jgi:transketolase
MRVNLIVVGAGYSYAVSGPTHQCYEDISLMCTLPTVRVLSPAGHVSAAALFDLTRSVGRINYLRFDAQPLPVLYQEAPTSIGSGLIVHSRGIDVTFVSTAYMTHVALDVAAALATQGVSVGIVDIIDLPRFDKAVMLAELVQSDAIVSLEDGFS